MHTCNKAIIWTLIYNIFRWRLWCTLGFLLFHLRSLSHRVWLDHQAGGPEHWQDEYSPPGQVRYGEVCQTRIKAQGKLQQQSVQASVQGGGLQGDQEGCGVFQDGHVAVPILSRELPDKPGCFLLTVYKSSDCMDAWVVIFSPAHSMFKEPWRQENFIFTFRYIRINIEPWQL